MITMLGRRSAANNSSEMPNVSRNNNRAVNAFIEWQDKRRTRNEASGLLFSARIWAVARDLHRRRWPASTWGQLRSPSISNGSDFASLNTSCGSLPFFQSEFLVILIV